MLSRANIKNTMWENPGNQLNIQNIGNVKNSDLAYLDIKSAKNKNFSKLFKNIKL